MPALPKLFRLALLLAACCVEHARAAEPTLTRDLQALLHAQQLAGAVVATVNGAKTDVFGLGVFHAGTRQPLQADHRVQVGSIAKTLLSLAVLRLVSQGKVDLDAPLAALLPALQLHNPWAARSPVRLRHLLDMTSGLPDLQRWHMFNQAHTANQPLVLALRTDLGPIRLRSEPGRQFSYSNLGFTLAGMVIEAVTGERYESWAARELLQPLGMMRSTFEFRRQGNDPELAWGHLDDGRPIADWPVAVRPAAHFTTTAADMARLMRFLLDEGRLDGQPFVRSELMAGLGMSPTTDTARAGLRSGYGLGLFTRDRHGAVGLCHGGSVAGWRAMFCVFLATRQGFFIALNSDREDADYAKFDSRLVQHLGLALPPVNALHSVQQFDSEWSGLYVPAPGRLEALALPDRLLGFWRLDLTPGRPTLREGLGVTRKLLPAGAGLYRQEDRHQATLALLRSADGQPMLGGSYITLRRVGLWEQAALWASAAFGALGTLALLPLALWRLRRYGLRTASARVPAAWALLAMGASLAAWALQGWEHMAAFTPITVAVASVSLLWPVACGAQLVQAWHHRRAWGGAGWEALLATASLQLCALLAAFGWLPLLPWRL
jgi:CubicO group peptidase (beta-lactamase class C family)